MHQLLRYLPKNNIGNWIFRANLHSRVAKESSEQVVNNLRSQTDSESSIRSIKTRGDPYKPSDFTTSIAYMKSSQYEQTYLSQPVWHLFRRNIKGQFTPKTTRSTCITKETYRTSNPCPICRDEHLTLHFENTELLKQFINPLSGDVLDVSITGICRRQQKKLLLEIAKAQELGLLEIGLPFRIYKYEDYFKDVETSIIDDFKEIKIPFAKSIEIQEQVITVEKPKVLDPYIMMEFKKMEKKKLRQSKKK